LLCFWRLVKGDHKF